MRVALAAVVTAYGAWKGRAWLVPIAMFLAVPGLWAFNWALLAAVPRLVAHDPNDGAHTPVQPEAHA